MIGPITTPGPAASPAAPVQPAPAAPGPTDAPTVRLELPPDASTCTPCGMEELRRAFTEQARDQRAMEADVTRQVAAAYAASRPCASC